MAYEWMWFNTELPRDVASILATDLKRFEANSQQSAIFGPDENPGVIHGSTRKSKHAWVPETHWCAGFVMHYAQLANASNYRYDLIGLDGHSLQYGIYKEGDHYDWHNDYSIENTEKHPIHHAHGVSDVAISSNLRASSEYVRKLSFSFQLSHPSEYDGGELQVVSRTGDVHTMPKDFGTIIFFDSRVVHKVAPVTRGERRSLVGWIIGPRWK